MFYRYDVKGQCSLEVLPSILREAAMSRLKEFEDQYRDKGEIEFYNLPEVEWIF